MAKNYLDLCPPKKMSDDVIGDSISMDLTQRCLQRDVIPMLLVPSWSLLCWDHSWGCTGTTEPGQPCSAFVSAGSSWDLPDQWFGHRRPLSWRKIRKHDKHVSSASNFTSRLKTFKRSIETIEANEVDTVIDLITKRKRPGDWVCSAYEVRSPGSSGQPQRCLESWRLKLGSRGRKWWSRRWQKWPPSPKRRSQGPQRNKI